MSDYVMIGHNLHGYLPESDPFAVKREDAYDAFVSELQDLCDHLDDEYDAQEIADCEAALTDLRDNVPDSIPDQGLAYDIGSVRYWAVPIERETMESEGWEFDDDGHPIHL